ncbi:hypothetical protein ARMSODRAFT_1026607 [Armillaria solidipes]|uniref:Uncharacterized protein n=1 Tax=Armillaria solidipes TaxID=1076256 RepID=A0A2H3BBJ6_9AGAR|nr:hypothetical protein ARMSODRAFT_1026607 [Armillaria solidipes]
MALTVTDLRGQYPMHAPSHLIQSVEKAIEEELVTLAGPPLEIQISMHPPHSPSNLIMCTVEGPRMGSYCQTCKDPTASLTCGRPITVTPPLQASSAHLKQLLDIRQRMQAQVPLPTKMTVLLWDQDFNEPWTFLLSPNEVGRISLKANSHLLA